MWRPVALLGRTAALHTAVLHRALNNESQLNIIPMFDVGNISLLVTALLLGMTKDCSCYCVAAHYLTTSLLAVSEVVLGMLATRY